MRIRIPILFLLFLMSITYGQIPFGSPTQAPTTPGPTQSPLFPLLSPQIPVDVPVPIPVGNFLQSLISRLPNLKQLNIPTSGISLEYIQHLVSNNLPNPAYVGSEKPWRNESFDAQPECSNNTDGLGIGSHGIITSPNYPERYSAGLKCQWILESEPGTVIRITFFDLVTQPWFLYFTDYLAVSLDGEFGQFYRLTGDMNKLAPISLESNGNKIGIRFVTARDFLNFRGFKMGWVVTRKALNDPGSTNVSGNSTGGVSDNSVSSNEVSAICDHVPLTPLKPAGTTGEIPIGIMKIVNGTRAKAHEFPFMVALLVNGTSFCGGSLIDTEHILTAAHCVYGNSSKIEVFLGVHDMNLEEVSSRQYQVVGPEAVYAHPNYNPISSTNDIALIKLARKVRITPTVQPVYLPSQYSMGNSFTGWNLTVMGWGETRAGGGGEGVITPILHKANGTVISNEVCRREYGHLITGNILCTGASSPTGSSPCVGDSGGPLVAQFTRIPNTSEEHGAVPNPDGTQAHQCVFTRSHRDKNSGEEGTHQEQLPSSPQQWFVQLGVLSFGSNVCGSGKPVGYTRVTAYMDFISGVLASPRRKQG